ncbi:hypothetical protein GCX98_06840 [Salmonella enterica subsp. diarizonae]|nr:hypothetical protein [Salmonella enterica]AXC67283.1 hypothetical protein DOE63_18295 [Salmonella enterica subsp. diarizonae serovar 59:z10:-]ECC1748121.1 hypothetical protein [Salmonella enterica subsp. diarizonae]ECF1926863.1 hypothetical protein [Salmonella enterica subsp. enterica serovar Java]EDD7085997.1 hypothetical protein [Salmonella enterica subsp. enterica serovar Enteritidis]EHS1317502.1 hypothetical protein [Salmonella enterica subsp. enterica serovar Reading]
MRSLTFLTIFLMFTGFILPAISYGADSNHERYYIPDNLYEQLERIGFNENELEEIAVDNDILSIKLDSDRLNIQRAYKIISFICDYTKNYTSEWQGIEFKKIEIMDFLQSKKLVFTGGIKNCLQLPLNANNEQIKPYTEIKRGY